MSLTIWLTSSTPRCDHCGRGEEIDMCVFQSDITHNLIPMARLAGVSECMWDAKKNGITKAFQLLESLQDAIVGMKAEPERFRALNPSNGWGNYEGFLAALVALCEACRSNPNADFNTWG